MSESDGSPVPTKRRRLNDDVTSRSIRKQPTKRTGRVAQSSHHYGDSDDDNPLLVSSINTASKARRDSRPNRTATESASEAPSRHGDKALHELRRKNAEMKKTKVAKEKVYKPKKPKHRIIVHTKSVQELEDMVATQLPQDDFSSSPWKERGAIIQKRPPREEWIDPYAEDQASVQGTGIEESFPSSPPIPAKDAAPTSPSWPAMTSQQEDHTGVGKFSRSPSRSRCRPVTNRASDSEDNDAFSTYVTKSQRALLANSSKANARPPTRTAAIEIGWEKECNAETSAQSDSMDEIFAGIKSDTVDARQRPKRAAFSSPAVAGSMPPDHAVHKAVNPASQRRPNTFTDIDIDKELADLPSDAFDLDEELANLPSDAFEDDDEFAQPRSRHGVDDPIVLSSFSPSAPARQKIVVAPRKNLQQRTLFGAVAQVAPGLVQSTQGRQLNFLQDMPLEPPTHHELSLDGSLNSWVYPTNLGAVRDYQFNIVSKALFSNTLVALPTGLGKTFIAATVMLNWYRWTKTAQIYFVAPTKPLVSQQVEACFGIAGIPYSDTSLLMGTVAPGLRAEEYKTKRVFFMTPQTIVNDFKTGIADPKRVVLLVVDEAHRATGAYAYVELVQFIRRFNPSFRVLALTATPGASVEAVQQVMDGLDIAKVEIRHEGSLDIKEYVHGSQIDSIIFDYTPELDLIMDLCSQALKPVLSQLNQFNAYWAKDPMQLTAFGLTDARKRWMNTAGKSASFGIKGMVNRIFTVLSSLAHNVSLLKFHGIGPFYHNMLAFRSSVGASDKGSKYEKIIVDSEPFRKMMSTMQFWINNPKFIGHPKLEELQNLVVTHFLNAGKDSPTRIMIFAAFRDSAEEIVRVLNRNTPEVRPHVFVGQAASKGSEGMDQKTQLDIMQKFKGGQYNVLVATSIGEEGLDIGQVDLIVCYDSSSSPIRMLQRMGRTGRRRAGRVYLLLMRGKEEESLAKAKDNYKKIQSMIEDGRRFKFHDDRSLRILPRECKPVPDKREVEIPAENSQAGLPVPSKRRGKAPKRPPKKYHMPDNVQTGFVRASGVGGNGEMVMLELAKGTAKGRGRGAGSRNWPAMSEILEPIPLLEDVLLTSMQTKELDRKYRKIHDGGGLHGAEIGAPDVASQVEAQRQLRATKLVGHGIASSRFTKTMASIYNIDDAVLQRWQTKADKVDLDELCGGTSLLDSASPPLAPVVENTGRAAAVQVANKAGNEPKGSRAARSKAMDPKPKPAPKAQPRPKKSVAAGRTVETPRTGFPASDAMEAPSSSAPYTSPGMCLPTQGEDLGSEDTEGEDEAEPEMDSELADWIVGSDEEIEVEASSAMSNDSAQRLDARRQLQPEELFDSDSDECGNGPGEGGVHAGKRATARARHHKVVDSDSDISSL